MHFPRVILFLYFPTRDVVSARKSKTRERINAKHGRTRQGHAARRNGHQAGTAWEDTKLLAESKFLQ